MQAASGSRHTHYGLADTSPTIPTVPILPIEPLAASQSTTKSGG